MASFLKRWFSGKSEPKGPEAFVGAFGKHPGWNDHIDDQGLETPELVTLKRLLYVQGIGGNIDAGAWDKLPEEEQLAGFKHLFVWRAEEDTIVGRMWSSSDGKGRKRYPMIVCLQARNVSLPWMLSAALPRLEALEAACVATTSAADVCRILDDARAEFRRLVMLPEAASRGPAEASALWMLAGRSEMGQDRRGLLSVLYQVEREMAAYRPNNRQDRGSRIVSIAPRQLRVPRCADSPEAVFKLWTRFLLKQLDPATPILEMLPLNGDWLDIIVGEPTIREVFSMRATPKKYPMTTEIPYTLDPEFVERSNRAIAASAATTE